jgi:hypothetical protein
MFTLLCQMNNNISVSTIPPKVKYNPFLKTEVFGIYIQNAESTKNKSDNPKKIFKKNRGC